jgi:arylsulfatase A-like enzyme/Flp pilus assembly protein TadD
MPTPIPVPAARPRGRPRLLPLLLAAAAMAIPACGTEQGPVRPDILLITVDSLRADRPGFMNGPVETPSMDRLAEKGVVFTRAISPVPQTLPSLASLHTGLYPPAHGVRDDGLARLRASTKTLAAILQEAGYRTGAFAAALALHPKYGLDRGFETYGEAFAEVPRPSVSPARGIPAPRIADRAIEWLGGATPDQHLFLWINFFDPHYFYEPPEPFRGQYGDQPYDGEVALVDREIGRVLDWLADHDRDAGTLIVLAGNHGEGLGDGGEQYHGILLRESTLRVPLVIRAPEGAASRVEDPASLIDLAPTILRLAGLEPPSEMQGESLAGFIHGGERPAAERVLYFETMLPRTFFGWTALRGVSSGALKYVEAPGGSFSALHDLAADPDESEDLSGARPEDARRLAAEVARIGGPAEPARAALPDPVADLVASLGLRVEPPEPASIVPQTMIDTGNAALQGHRSFQRRMGRAATFLFREVLEEDPGNYVALVDSGSMMMSVRRTREAEELLERAQARYPADGEVYHILGHLAIQQARQVEDLERAKRLFQTAVRLAPLNEEALYDLACGTATEDQEMALGYLEEAIRNGFRDYRYMAMDADLDPIRHTARFESITGASAAAAGSRALHAPGAVTGPASPSAASRLAALAALAACLLLLLPACSATSEPDPVRNVVLITIDTLRADRLGAYGGRRIGTPIIDAFAGDAVLFENAFSPVPLTAPSHSTMLTGRYPITHGVRLNGTAILPDEETTLAEIARDRGMRTAAIVSCLVLASRFGLNQGFDLYFEEGISGEPGKCGLWFDERKAVRSIDRAVRWLRAESDRPFFLWLHLFDPHHPFDPPPPFNHTYRDRPYDGEVVYTDRALGKFMAALKDLGVYENSLIILASDHGESLGEHNENFHGTFLYDATLHVPLMVRAPGGRRGVRVREIVSTIDIMPTALDAMGVPIPGDVQGVSLMPAIAGRGRPEEHALYIESVYPSATYGWAEIRGVRTPRLKFLDLSAPELYDLGEDPRELKNLHAMQPAEAESLRGEYEALAARLGETARRETATAELDEDFRDRLLSLGYIAGTESKVKRGTARDPKEVILLTEPLGYGAQLLKDKKYDEAVNILSRAVNADPENKIGLVKLGQALAGAGRRAEAKATLRRAAEIYPDSEEVYRILGWMHVKDGEYDEAAELMAGLIHQLPRSSQAHYMYGFAFFYAREWDRALEALKQARELNPRFSKAPYLMAICYEQTGRREEAIRALHAYLRLEPNVELLFRDPYFESLRASREFSHLIRGYL